METNVKMLIKKLYDETITDEELVLLTEELEKAVEIIKEEIKKETI